MKKENEKKRNVKLTYFFPFFFPVNFSYCSSDIKKVQLKYFKNAAKNEKKKGEI